MLCSKTVTEILHTARADFLTHHSHFEFVLDTSCIFLCLLDCGLDLHQGKMWSQSSHVMSTKEGRIFGYWFIKCICSCSESLTWLKQQRWTPLSIWISSKTSDLKENEGVTLPLDLLELVLCKAHLMNDSTFVCVEMCFFSRKTESLFFFLTQIKRFEFEEIMKCCKNCISYKYIFHPPLFYAPSEVFFLLNSRYHESAGFVIS